MTVKAMDDDALFDTPTLPGSPVQPSMRKTGPLTLARWSMRNGAPEIFLAVAVVHGLTAIAPSVPASVCVTADDWLS